MGCLLVSVAATASGVIPVLELDFTRSAIETLKKRGIDDACIVAAPNPDRFTYCREGSTTLWQYQALDLAQQAKMQNGEKLPVTEFGRITVAQVDSVACEDEHSPPLIKPAITRGLVLGLITLLLLIALRYTYRAIMHGFEDQTELPDPRLQRFDETLSARNSTAKALFTFGIAAAVAFVYFGFLVH
jgi:hypothetical protein